MSIECEFCHVMIKKYYKSIHQTSTLKCLAIQKSLGHTITPQLFTCKHCNKTQTTKDNNIKHEKICKVKLRTEKEVVQKKLSDTNQIVNNIKDTFDDRLEELASDFRTYKEESEYNIKIKEEQVRIKEDELKKEISELKKQIKELQELKLTCKTTTNSKNKITNSHNTTNNNITIQTVMTPERVEEFFKKHYKLDTLLEGQKGLARFVTEGFLKSTADPLYQCTDRSRQKFVMKQADGSIKEDTNCEHLVNLTKPGLDHVSDVYETSLFEKLPNDVKESDIHDSYRTISELGTDRVQFKNELSKIIPSEQSNLSTDESIWERMKSKIECPETIIQENIIYIPKPDIGGMSRGKLSVYRDRYKKDGTIKYPKQLQEKINMGDSSFQKEYLDFLQE
jgi:hypothetical protein